MYMYTLCLVLYVSGIQKDRCTYNKMMIDGHTCVYVTLDLFGMLSICICLRLYIYPNCQTISGEPPDTTYALGDQKEEG